MKRTICLVAGLTMLAAATARADVTLPKIFGDQMVLQHQSEAAVWGWADPDEEATVSLGEAKATTKAGADRKWQVKSATPAASGTALELVVKGKNPFRITSVECENGSFQFEADDESKKIHIVTVTYRADGDAGLRGTRALGDDG